MKMVPNLQEARDLLKNHNSDEFHLLHGEVAPRIMDCFAHQNDPQNEEYWAAVGMLHNIDFELSPEEHCAKCVESLRSYNIDEDMIRSIVSHGYGRLDWVTVRPEPHMEKILFATDELSGLIGACAMVQGAKMLGISLEELMQQTLDAIKTLVDVLPI